MRWRASSGICEKGRGTCVLDRCAASLADGAERGNSDVKTWVWRQILMDQGGARSIIQCGQAYRF